MNQEKLLEYLEERRFKELKEELEYMHPVDIAELMEELEDKQMILVFRLLDKDAAAETFTEMEAKQCTPDIVQLVKRYAGENMPIAVTGQIGHGTDAKGIVIGAEL